MDDMLGLEQLAAAFTTHQPGVSAIETAYAVRQIHLTIGCQHECTHCFSSAPKRMHKQINLAAFERLAKEFGTAAIAHNRPFEFLFLGSMTDPSSVSNYATYQDIWLDSTPTFCHLRIHTHGWDSRQPDQSVELASFLESIRRFAPRIDRVNLSIDTFSAFARENWEEYLANLGHNLRLMRGALHDEQIRLIVLYGLTRIRADERATLRFWQSQPNTDDNSIDRDIRFQLERLAHLRESAETAHLTSAMLDVGRAAGWTTSQTLRYTRDAGFPMASGRGKELYKGTDSQLKEEGFDWHRQRAFKRLDPVAGIMGGIQIFPDGRARLLNYEGYRQGAWLGAGDRLIPYM